ncbi:MAG: bacillithiol system redox-active protein YtxJ [Pyrinomonadaceae bacterium]|nr:bacillithiol system redox-active protein YtxJ [Pyrinomonadaceae bacterium]
MANFLKVDTLEELDELFERSHEQPVVVFKHSNSCGISSHLFEEIGSVDADVNVVVVQEARHVSDAIAERTGFRHHSPQAFVIRQGKAVYQASHYAIDPQKISAEIGEA